MVEDNSDVGSGGGARCVCRCHEVAALGARCNGCAMLILCAQPQLTQSSHQPHSPCAGPLGVFRRGRHGVFRVQARYAPARQKVIVSVAVTAQVVVATGGAVRLTRGGG